MSQKTGAAFLAVNDLTDTHTWRICSNGSVHGKFDERLGTM